MAEANETAKVDSRKKILPVISIALSFLSMWVSVSVMPLLCLGGLVLAAVSMARDKNSWSTGAMMISIMSIAVTLMFVVPNLVRG